MSRRAKKTNARRSCDAEKRSPLLSLPREIQEDIICYTGPSERCALRLVCSYFCNVVDHCRAWQHTCLSISNICASQGECWQLLRERRVAALDISCNSCSASQLEYVLTALPHLRELHISTSMLFHLGRLHCLGLMDHISRVKVKDTSEVEPNYNCNSPFRVAMPTSWAMLVTPTLSNISKLTIHHFRPDDVCRLLSKLVELRKLEFLDLELAMGEFQKIVVEARLLSTLLYKLRKLTHLRLSRIALDSLDDVSPFDPTTCPAEHRIPASASLRLKTLDLQLELTEENEDSEVNLLRKSDLRFMPELTCLKYGMHSSNRFHERNLFEIDMDDWNMGKTGLGCALEELHVHYGRGTCLGKLKKSLDWLSRLPTSLHTFSLSKSIGPANLIIIKLGVSLGASLRNLYLSATRLFTDEDLNLVAVTFVKLNSFTCGTTEDIRAESLLLFERLPNFRRLQLTSSVPDVTLTTARANMTQHFTISVGYPMVNGIYRKIPFRH